MLNFFKKIRQKLINENRLSRYLLYAIGEILLVVIGILIALQINTWNQERKNHKLKKQYLESLISDLKQDSIQLKNQNFIMSKDLKLMQSYGERLSKPSVTIDTLYQISRYEFKGGFNPDNTLNQNTINSLIASGHLNLFDIKFREDLFEHRKIQETTLKVVDENFQIYFQTLFQNKRGPVERPNRIITTAIKGQLLDRIWNNFNEDDHLYAFNKVLTNKIVMESIVIRIRDSLISNTNKHLNYIYQYNSQ